ncbi:MAG TPA: DUF1015 domain-containing protein [Anaerolineaceae bacterium]
MRNYPQVALQVPDILLPSMGIDMTRWSVIACDQFTSQPEYWQQIEQFVAEAPSTLHMVLPEVYLGKIDESARIAQINQTMRSYLNQGILQSFPGMIYVERTFNGKTRHGIMAALDLEQYDYTKGSASLIRATEGTIIERIPPRVRIRQDAPLEIPHILVLIDDPNRTVIEPLKSQLASEIPLYDFDLMMGSGHVRGTQISSLKIESQVVNALSLLAKPEAFHSRYQLSSNHPVLLYAVGDGNHSLATAKNIWQKMKPSVSGDHPARYALVEIENIHDEGLEFEPIHRIIFNIPTTPVETIFEALKQFYPGRVLMLPCLSFDAMKKAVHEENASCQTIGLIAKDQTWVIQIIEPPSNIAVGTLQSFLDAWLPSQQGVQIDYVHDDQVVLHLGSQTGNLGIYLPPLQKSQLFKTVILDGVLPRKTFSMGQAKEKRFYLECRRITG